jgi:hypothetical protein
LERGQNSSLTVRTRASTLVELPRPERCDEFSAVPSASLTGASFFGRSRGTLYPVCTPGMVTLSKEGLLLGMVLDEVEPTAMLIDKKLRATSKPSSSSIYTVRWSGLNLARASTR